MNNIQLIGRLTHDVEVKETANKEIYARMSIAVNRGEEVNFFDLVAYDKTADLVAKYVSKGDRIGIIGRVQTGTYDRKLEDDIVVATKTWTIVVKEVHFLESKKEETPKTPEVEGRRRY